MAVDLINELGPGGVYLDTVARSVVKELGLTGKMPQRGRSNCSKYRTIVIKYHLFTKSPSKLQSGVLFS